MIHVSALIAAPVSAYRKCPRCGKFQLFRGAKKGDLVTCTKCSHQFVLR